MKKLILWLFAIASALPASADEGMWLLPYLEKLNLRQMQEQGCRLTAEQIYSAFGPSLKDAIVIFGSGCTGEIVSPDGLLLTNHHCGYGSIQALSSVEHDYLTDGFWASSREEELPAPGLEVRFVRKIEEVTADVVGNIPDIARGEERARLAEQNAKRVVEQLRAANPGRQVIVKSFFGGNQYFAFIHDVFEDVRLVGTPPSSIGKFGGDTDNWMWPRHTGDFSIFRVYASPENLPAAYSPENVPYRAETYLKVSLDGYRENDFGMIMGFPGSTERYMTTSEIDEMLEITNPNLIRIREERQNILSERMAASDRIRIQYASKYARSSNYWKNAIGMSRGIRNLDVRGKKQAQEDAFRMWAERNTLPTEGYIDALPMIYEAIDGTKVSRGAIQAIGEIFIRNGYPAAIEVFYPANLVSLLSADSVSDGQREMIVERLESFYKDYDTETDRLVARRMMQIAKELIPQMGELYERIDRQWGGNTDAYVDDLYARSVFADRQSALNFVENFSKESYFKDPAVELLVTVNKVVKELVDSVKEGGSKFVDGHRLYIAGLMLMQPDKAWYPDANFTLRLTYGKVRPYDPADGISYRYYTTLKGVMEKEDPSNPTDFTVPEKLKRLYAERDYGRYADARGELPVAFLIDCDITGGNSGSPVMNGDGELIGLAFDGNWEAMSGDVAFEPELQRTISVDIRYVLFIIDKYADAGWIVDEMTLSVDREQGDAPTKRSKSEKKRRNRRG